MKALKKTDNHPMKDAANQIVGNLCKNCIGSVLWRRFVA